MTTFREDIVMSVSIEHPTDKVNFTIVHLSERSIAFSYETIIGVATTNPYEWTLRENEWGPTTGKHLNYLSEDKASRLSSSKFEELLKEIGL